MAHTPTAFRHFIRRCQKDHRDSEDVHWDVYTGSPSPTHVIQEMVLYSKPKIGLTSTKRWVKCPPDRQFANLCGKGY